jgi:signal transduction histidine kinase
VAVAAAGLVAWLNGAERSAVAGASALAMAPALAGFILIPRLGQKWVDIGWLTAWLLAAIGMITGSGGALSPLAVLFAIPPALASALGRRWAPEAGAAGVMGYAGAAVLALGVPQQGLEPFQQVLSVIALAFAAALIALGQSAGGRAEAMSQRVAEVSHELRTPLTHILGFSEMIERQLFGEIGARYVEYAGLIRRSGTHLLGLVNDLLDLSKIDAGRYDLVLEDFDIGAAIEEVVRLSVDAAEKKQIALGMVTPQPALVVRADERAVKRMLINTVGNALKFTPEGGRVMVVAETRDDALVIETIDSGPGIPEAERATLGQAYERGIGGARAEGTGLGLALVRALARLHGGTLSFHEAPGGGALVRVTLPVLKD